MSLWLHVTAHDAEAHERFAVLRDKRRNDGVEWPFVRRIRIQFAFLQVEESAAILQRKAKPCGTNAGTESKIKALDERHHVALFVGGGQINSVALIRQISRLVRFGGAPEMNELSALRRIFLGD